MRKSLNIGMCFFLLIVCQTLSFGQKIDITTVPFSKVDEQVMLYYLESDTLFKSKQQVYILWVPKSSPDKYEIGIAYSDTLAFTSQIAQEENAIAAINGSFFDMDQGGSVTYHEKDGAVLYNTMEEGNKWAFDKALLTGAIIIDHSDNLSISRTKPDEYFRKSKKESEVLVSGPLLLLENKKQEMPDVPFVNNRHPRTCLCDTGEDILFVTVDGRSEPAEGMNLHELQTFMSLIGCKDAINLDGGGSVTMWADQQVINTPSDAKGERPVANVIIIKKQSE